MTSGVYNMTPVFQDKFYVAGVPEAKQRGNCWSAALASLLDLPLAAVPNFVEIDVLGGPNWWWHTDKYLGLLGYELKWGNRNPPQGYYIMSGISPRSTEDCVMYHAVIGREGKMVHDPHPDGQGLLNVTQVQYLDKTGFRY